MPRRPRVHLDGICLFSRSGDDLSITVLGGTDGITIQKWYSGSEDRVEEFHTTEKSVLFFLYSEYEQKRTCEQG
ncbi:MAG: calcium-binding protein [Gammaproteobacteria bacterium]